jgi:hypothetical protein
MVNSEKNSQRFILAISLFTASVISAIVIALISNQTADYWIVARPVPQGVALTRADLSKASANLKFGNHSYIPTTENPIGAYTRRALTQGELLQTSTLASNQGAVTTQFVPLSIRASDFPGGAGVGDTILVYQVHDARNGETPMPPVLVLEHASITSISQKGANFGSDLSVTLAISERDLPTLLAATSSGRIVAIKSHE